MSKDTQKKRIITIAGLPGSGKSTAARHLAERLSYEHFSAGGLLRKLGKELGLDIYQTNLAAESQSNLDEMVDQRSRELGETRDKFIIDGRMAWYCIPQSFKVYLELYLGTAARRFLENIDPVRAEHEHIPSDPDAYATVLRKRLESEARRYQAYYNANPYDASNYDLVINTASNNAEQVVDQILTAYHHWLGSEV